MYRKYLLAWPLLVLLGLMACGGGGDSSAPATVQMGGAIQGMPLNLTTAVSTLAGDRTPGYVDNPTGTLAEFDYPSGITTDGTNLYVADSANNRIRQIVIATGAVTTIAGDGTGGYADGPGALAEFKSPQGITTDGTNLYVADSANNRIRQIVIATGAVTTIAGDGTLGYVDNPTGTLAEFRIPQGITTDGTNLYIADIFNHCVRKVVIATGAVTTIAGDGTEGYVDNANGTLAEFNGPSGITTDGTSLYVTDGDNEVIRRIVIATGAVTTFAGSGTYGYADGPGALAAFKDASGITTDGANLYVADQGNNRIRKIVIDTRVVTTVAGDGTYGYADSPTGALAEFKYPLRITTDGTSLYVTDIDNSSIRKIHSSSDSTPSCTLSGTLTFVNNGSFSVVLSGETYSFVIDTDSAANNGNEVARFHKTWSAGSTDGYSFDITSVPAGDYYLYVDVYPPSYMVYGWYGGTAGHPFYPPVAVPVSCGSTYDFFIDVT